MAKLGMEETWRWYGPNDLVSLDDVKQAGATGIVTALHDVPTGAVWTEAAVAERKAIIEAAGLSWSVVESIPVHESIKYGGPDRDGFIDAYCQSIRNVGACGIDTLCYNFMPVVDWTRTNLDFEWGDGSKALRFDRLNFAAFELHILKRPGAEVQYTPEQLVQAKGRFDELTEQERATITTNVVAGMPGRMTSDYGGGLAAFQAAIDKYAGLTDVEVRGNLRYFLERIIPVAAEVGVFMAIHPDDPPIPLFGLPRVVSTQQHLRDLLAMVPSVHNGLTICVGTMASRPDNDVKQIVEAFPDQIHFVHMRNVEKDSDQTFFGSFTEADHLTGDIDMFHVFTVMLKEQRRRQAANDPKKSGPSRLPFRPDHGHRMLDDLQKETNPGYTAIGRLRGLAELRGLELGVLRSGMLHR